MTQSGLPHPSRKSRQTGHSGNCGTGRSGGGFRREATSDGAERCNLSGQDSSSNSAFASFRSAVTNPSSIPAFYATICRAQPAAEWPSRTWLGQGYALYPWIGRHRERTAIPTPVPAPCDSRDHKAVSCRGPAFFVGIDKITPTGAAQTVTPVPGLPPAALTRPGERPGRSSASRRLYINHHARCQRRDPETGRFI